MRALLALGLLASPLALLACSGDDSNAPGGADATAPEASTSVAHDAGTDGPTACGALADFCASDVCPTYDVAVNHPSESADDAGDSLCSGAFALDVDTCGAYSAVTQSGTDTGVRYYYDATSHALAAIRYFGEGLSDCWSAAPMMLADLPSCAGPRVDIGCAKCPPVAQATFPQPQVADAVPGACTDEQIDAYAACLRAPPFDAGAACDRFGDAGVASDRACADCLAPPEPARGAIAFDALLGVNVAGCVALLEGDGGATKCGDDIASAMGCAEGACHPRCLFGTLDDSFGCESAALRTVCADQVGDGGCFDRDAGLAAQCGLFASSFTDQLRAVGRQLCGGAAPDAGGDASDGGSDASDAGAD